MQALWALTGDVLVTVIVIVAIVAVITVHHAGSRWRK